MTAAADAARSRGARKAGLRERGVTGDGRDGLVYADLDGIGECLDALQSAQAAADASNNGSSSSSTSNSSDHNHTPSRHSSTEGTARDTELDALAEAASAWLLSMECAAGGWPHVPFPLHDPLRVRLLHLPHEDAVDDYSASCTHLRGLASRRAALAHLASLLWCWCAVVVFMVVLLPPLADDALHATWAVTTALCDKHAAARSSSIRLQPARRHAERMRTLMRETRFHEQDVPKRARSRRARAPRGSVKVGGRLG